VREKAEGKGVKVIKVVLRILIHQLTSKDFSEVKMDTSCHPLSKFCGGKKELKLGDIVILDEIVLVRSFKHMYSFKIFCHKYFTTLHQSFNHTL